MTPSRVLVLDDDPAFLSSLRSALPLSPGFALESCSSAEQAVASGSRNYYDVIICDVRLPYQGKQDGGLEVAKQLGRRFPTSSIILISEFVTARLVNQLMGKGNYRFVEKSENLIADLTGEIQQILVRRYVFVLMPFSQEFDDVYHLAIKETADELGFKCQRADEIQHNAGILPIVFRAIEAAHLVIADMTGQNPNVCYELGYAHGLGKEVILLTQNVDDIPFDLRGFNHIIYGGKLVYLKDALGKRIEGLYGLER